ncbi:hypothetical protein RND71_003431 [Anisodus tanguticus]|uniref:Uncharacterized protein n=1 Tax=Anisodus tanguticus TaxID=243964 RepID=A0AAE1SWM7_9SOLA|nr:hypothetical protein RND71_003431 [Anisodus tanguticus]
MKAKKTFAIFLTCAKSYRNEFLEAAFLIEDANLHVEPVHSMGNYSQVKKLCPKDPNASKKLKECEKAVMKQKFEEAIALHNDALIEVVELLNILKMLNLLAAAVLINLTLLYSSVVICRCYLKLYIVEIKEKSQLPNPMFTHLDGRTSTWKVLSPQVLRAAFKVLPDVEKQFSSKRTAGLIHQSFKLSSNKRSIEAVYITPLGVRPFPEPC